MHYMIEAQIQVIASGIEEAELRADELQQYLQPETAKLHALPAGVTSVHVLHPIEET